MSEVKFTAPEPGIYPDVPFDEYLRWPYVSNSALGIASRSMAHYRHAPPMQPTAAMNFGSLVHYAKLEPAALTMRYAVMPDLAADIRKPDGTKYSNVRATNAYKDAVEKWRETIGDREVCTAEDLERMLGMVEALTMHDRARQYLCGEGPTELSLVWDDMATGVMCKARIDKCNTHVLADLKTTVDARDFEKSIARYGYHRQAAFYQDGYRRLTGETRPFAIVAVEKEKPFAVRAATVAKDAVELGRRQYQDLLQRIHECRTSNVWPGYDDPGVWQLPGWYMDQHDAAEITIDGEVFQV